MVAEVVRLLGYTKNARILTNPATEMLHGVAFQGTEIRLVHNNGADWIVIPGVIP